jgi:4-amino-4-deoxy-L-arabinose transferase-like glycosyltransferase
MTRASTARSTHGSPASGTALRMILAGLLLGCTTLLLTALTRGLSPSLIEADEGGHYVNALFLGDWIRAGFPSPLAFARSFYAHFPRLTIGHWPPGWYMIEAPLFALVRPSPQGAAYLSAFLSGVPGVAIVWAFGRLGRPRAGVALGLAYAVLPLVIENGRYLLVDQPLALIVALAAIAWAAAAARPTWPRMLGFALLAAACPLIKGNGALIALVPAVDIALTGRWRLLRHGSLWGAALLALAIVVPWYWLSFAISAEGFNYAPGFPYAWLALMENGHAIVASLGLAGVALVFASLPSLMPGVPDQEQRIARLAWSVVIATLVFQSVVPAALAPRYVAPALPWLVVLAGLGLFRVARLGRAGPVLAAALAVGTLFPAAVTLATLPAKPDIGAPGLAQTMTARGGLWLVDGESGAEGALIAQAAYADAGTNRLWVARASQWLSTSDFMGRGYRLTVTDPVAVRGVLDRIGAAGVTSVARRGQPAFAHSRLLLAAVETPAFRTTRQPFVTGAGKVLFATRRTAIAPNVALLATDSGSAKVAKMTNALR